MSGTTVLYIILSIISFGYLIEQVIEYLNVRFLQEKPPTELSGLYEDDQSRKSISYQRALGFSILQTGLMLFVLQYVIFNEHLSFALGGTEYAIHLNLIAFAILYGPISKVFGMLSNVISRNNEYEANAYATHTYGGEPLQSALKKLSVHNLSNLRPHPWYVFANYSHPPLLQRLRAIDRIKNL